MSWLVDTLLVTGALILAVLVLRRPVTRWFGPGLAYALWLLPLLRLVLPPITLPQPAVPAGAVTVLVEPAAAVATAAGSVASGWDLAALALPLWLGGALAFLAWRAWGYAAMRRRLLAGADSVGEIEGVRLVEGPAIASPVAFGVFDKVIALPEGFMAQPDAMRRDLAVAHELEHHRGRDLAVNLAVQPLFALHWFNPLAWYGWRALRRDQEAACDARVLAGSCPERRAQYGRLIASFAGGPRLALAAPMACPVLGEKSIVHRLRSLTMTQPSPKRRLLGRVLIGAAALALPLTASISYAQNEDPPAPPAPPAAADAPHAPHVQRHVIIIDNPAGTTIDPANPDADTSGLHTRVINRDGRTIVLKTSRELSEAEAEEHVARAMANIPEIPDAPTPPDAAAAPDAPEAPQLPRRIVMVRTEGGPADGAPHVIALGDPAQACADGAQARTVRAESNENGQRNVRVIRMCNHGGSPEHALTALRAARERLAANTELSEQIRGEVLADLDREIARLSADD